jgi:hypothetical protein
MGLVGRVTYRGCKFFVYSPAFLVGRFLVNGDDFFNFGYFFL